MLFQGQAQQFIEQSLIRAKWEAESERMAEADKRFCLYSDDYEDIIRETMRGLFHKDNYERLYYHVNGSQNILKRVVNEISMVYKREAMRNLSAKSDRWAQIKSEVDIDARMKRANRLANLLNDIILKVGIRNGRMAYDIITPDICSVIQDPRDPTRIQAALWLRTAVNTPSSSGIEYEYIDDLGWWVVLDKDFRSKQIYFDPSTYPYRSADGRLIMPLVPIHRTHPETSFWDQDSGRDLYNAAVMMGVKMTQLDYYFKAASFKQIYVAGQSVSVPEKQVLDPLTAFKVNIDPGGSAVVGTLDLQPHLKELIEALVFQLNSVINNYGISADMWTLSISEMSGRALKIKNRALLEQREEQIPVYRAAERELFEATKVVNNTHASFMGWEKIPENAELETDFPEVDFPEDPNYEIDLEAKRLKSGLISLGKFYQRFNADEKDEAEAERKMLENLNKLKEAREANPTLDEALDYIMKGVKKQAGGVDSQGDIFAGQGGGL